MAGVAAASADFVVGRRWMENASPAPRMATARRGDLVRVMSKGFGGAAGRRVMPNSCGLADDGDDGAAPEVVVCGRRAVISPCIY